MTNNNLQQLALYFEVGKVVPGYQLLNYKMAKLHIVNVKFGFLGFSIDSWILPTNYFIQLF